MVFSVVDGCLQGSVLIVFEDTRFFVILRTVLAVQQYRSGCGQHETDGWQLMVAIAAALILLMKAAWEKMYFEIWCWDYEMSCQPC